MRLIYEITFKKHIHSIYFYHENLERCALDCLSTLVSWTIRRNWRRCIESACCVPWYVYSIFGVIRDRRYEKVRCKHD